MVTISNDIMMCNMGESSQASGHPEKRYIYFNPNFSINNINVKELVARAAQTSPDTSHPDQSHSKKRALVPSPPETEHQFKRPHSISQRPPSPPPAAPVYRGQDIDWDDRSDPWYHRTPYYHTNLLNLAKDYALRPDRRPRCPFPIIPKPQLVFRMEKLHFQGKLDRLFKSSLNIEKFLRYMRIVQDQIEFDLLKIDYRNNQSYAECRRKRAMMKQLHVNKYHYVNQDAVEELFARSQNLKGFKKAIRKDLDLSKIDTSKLSSKQRRFLFTHHVYKQGKRIYLRGDDDDEEAPSTSSPPSPHLISLNKYKAVSSSALEQAKVKKRSLLSINTDCRFYIKSGKCKFGTRCIRKHDPSKLPTSLKRRYARRQPKSVFSVNNLRIPRIPRRPQRGPPPLVDCSSLDTASSSDWETMSESSSTTTLSRASTVVKQPAPTPTPSLYRTDYRFITNTTVGPTRVGLNKKLVNKALKWKRQTAKRGKQDCMFFIRRGRCLFGEECRKRHDPNKVSLCNKFIFTSNCTATDCPYQHKIIRDKMPLCLYFYAGRCSKDNCPFLHVKLGIDVHVCDKFMAGHCDKGELCSKRHTRDCEEHFETGICLDVNCKLMHQKIMRNRTCSFSSINSAMDVDRPYFDGDDFIPISGGDAMSVSSDIMRMLDNSDVESIADSIRSEDLL